MIYPAGPSRSNAAPQAARADGRVRDPAPQLPEPASPGRSHSRDRHDHWGTGRPLTAVRSLVTKHDGAPTRQVPVSALCAPRRLSVPAAGRVQMEHSVVLMGAPPDVRGSLRPRCRGNWPAGFPRSGGVAVALPRLIVVASERGLDGLPWDASAVSGRPSADPPIPRSPRRRAGRGPRSWPVPASPGTGAGWAPASLRARLA
jgi:hypothetical protein